MLTIYNETTLVGTIDYGEKHVRLTYDPHYLSLPHPIPLSASLPLETPVIDSSRVDNFLWNLLPESPEFYRIIGSTFKISDPSDPLSILTAIGRDTAGALSFYPQGVSPMPGGELQALTTSEIAQELRWLTKAVWSQASRISLAGAQAKTSYRRGADGRWYRPTGTLASTHIFKPASENIRDLDLVEFFVTTLAHHVGIHTVTPEMASFDDQRTFITPRYDRAITTSGNVRRLHQEDLLQVLGKSPRLKYQSDGGVNAVDLISAVQRLDPQSEPEIWKRLAFHVIVGNSDAHGKNWSFLIDSSGHHLAPAYDLISLEPFPYDHQLAMQIGHQWEYKAVTQADWLYQARRSNSDPHMVLDAITSVYDQLATALTMTRDSIPIDSPILDTITSLVTSQTWPVTAISSKADLRNLLTHSSRAYSGSGHATPPPYFPRQHR